MRVEEYVGQRIQARLTELGMTHQVFGERVGEYLGKPWSRSAVSVALRGGRGYTAAELVSISLVTGLSPGQLLTPPVDVDVIELPSGRHVRRDEMVKALSSLTQAGTRPGIAQGTLDTLREIEQLAAGTQQAAARLRDVGEVLLQPVDPEAIYPLPLRPVVAAIVTSGEGVLVGRRNDGIPPWTFIAGQVDFGERPEDAAVREVKEEAGLLVTVGSAVGERVHPKTGRSMIYIAAQPAHGTSIHVGDEAELAEVRWVSLAELDELMPDAFGPVRAYLEQALSPKEPSA